MKLKYYIEEDYHNDVYCRKHQSGGPYQAVAPCSKIGMLVLESDPQIRSIFLQSQSKNMIRVPFPYTQFVFQYYKTKDGKYIYPGLDGVGLRIYGRKKPLSKMTDKVFALPTDMDGYVCTDHDYDYKLYDSLFDMTQEILALWWGTRQVIHECYYDLDDWVKSESFKTVKWITLKNRVGVGTDILLDLISDNEIVEGYIHFRKKLPDSLIDKDWTKEINNEIALSR